MTSTTVTPKVGFVSQGCPKALTDSELILTQLSAEGFCPSGCHGQWHQFLGEVNGG